MIAMSELLAKGIREYKEGSIVKGRILEVRPREVLVDIGYKSEGIIPLSEFDDGEEPQMGDEVEVLLVRLENDEGMVILSKERAAYRQNWEKIAKVFEEGGIIKGKVKAVVKGGLTVNIGVEAFLPGSQIDVVPPKDLTQFVGNTYDFKIVKINDDRKNVVLSRRELIEQERAEKRARFMDATKIGDKVTGTVKNLTDFGAFIDLDGMDGLLHITDITWGRLGHPSEMLKVGQELELVVLDINKEKERVSLGLKQTQHNPWDKIEERFPANTKVKGKVTNLMPYGAFVEIEPGVEGLIHVSELSWTKRIARPSDVLTVGQELEAVVLGVNKDEQKISLGVRQLEPNPWDQIEVKYQIGTQIRGQVRNLTAYGAFVELEEGIDGMVPRLRHELDPEDQSSFRSGEEGRRARRGRHRHRQAEPADQPRAQAARRRPVEGDRSALQDRRPRQRQGLEARELRCIRRTRGDIEGLVHISQISEDRVEKVKDYLKVGDEIQARVIKVDKTERRIGLSVKAANYSDEDIKKEAAAFDTAIKPGTDLVGLEQAFAAAAEEYRPGEAKKK
jgi:small subunit ribosomal protein S1